MTPSLATAPGALLSDVIAAIRKHPGLSLLSFFCCIPFVAFAPDVSDRARKGLGVSWLAVMLIVGAASAVRDVLVALQRLGRAVPASCGPDQPATPRGDAA